jgi:hypothetical protein
VGEETTATTSKSTTTTTFRSISEFALPSMHHNNSPLLLFSIFETSATALCGTTGTTIPKVWFHHSHRIIAGHAFHHGANVPGFCWGTETSWNEQPNQCDTSDHWDPDLP